MMYLNDIVFPSKHANCQANTSDNSSMTQFSDILTVTSRRSKIDSSGNVEEILVTSEEMEQFHRKLALLERSQKSHLTDTHPDATISFIAKSIENRIMATDRFYCFNCANVFNENEKSTVLTINSNPPCISTFQICKQADKFLKMEILKNNTNFNVILYAIYEGINLDDIYTNTDFDHSNEHKVFLVQNIAKQFIHIKNTWLAKKRTLEIHEEKMRNRFLKLTHTRGQ